MHNTPAASQPVLPVYNSGNGLLGIFTSKNRFKENGKNYGISQPARSLVEAPAK